jgi:hypothetical protein
MKRGKRGEKRNDNVIAGIMTAGTDEAIVTKRDFIRRGSRSL